MIAQLQRNDGPFEKGYRKCLTPAARATTPTTLNRADKLPHQNLRLLSIAELAGLVHSLFYIFFFWKLKRFSINTSTTSDMLEIIKCKTIHGGFFPLPDVFVDRDNYLHSRISGVE